MNITEDEDEIKAATVRLPKTLKKDLKKWLVDVDLNLMEFHIYVVKWAIKQTKEEFFNIISRTDTKK